MYHRLTIFFLLFLFSCNQEAPIDYYSNVQSEKYKADFFKRYAKYNIKDNIKNGVEDFVSIYSSCGIIKYKSSIDYNIIQSYQIYTMKDSISISTLDYELIRFKNPSLIDSTIRQIKEKNCIDEQTAKIHRIYRVGKNAIIGVSFYKFNIVEYEDFLFKEFDKKITIELINISN